MPRVIYRADSYREELLRERVLAFGRMPPADLTALKVTIQRWSTLGFHAYVVFEDPRENKAAPFGEGWELLRGDTRFCDERHLILIFDGHGWDATGWSLSPEQANAALKSAERELTFGAYFGISDALNRLGAMATRTAYDARYSHHDIAERRTNLRVASGIGVLALAAVGWLVVRRQKRAAAMRSAGWEKE